MGIQVCPLPTAVFSTHGMFPGYVSQDLTDYLRDCLQHWRDLELRFEAVYSGFFNSVQQIDLVASFLRDVPQQDRLVVIDPVLGDNGKLYGVTLPDLVAGMRTYIRLADVITPNLTEAALLLNEPYQSDPTEDVVNEWLVRLAETGPSRVVITSVPVADQPSHTTVVAYDHLEGRYWRVICERIPATFPGTGDTFTSILVGCLLQGDRLPAAVVQAVQFITTAIRATVGRIEREGILLECVLDVLERET
jgi:pyridoxine kinase